jgi:molecular chaperone GrpE
MTDPPASTPPSSEGGSEPTDVEFVEAEVSESATATDADPADGEAGDAARPAEPTDPLTAALADATRFRDQLLRTAADFDNFRKRSRREIADAERKGREDLLRELLPVFDNLERAQAHSDSATDVKSLAEGIGMVLRQFHDTLGRLGIERVPTVGTPFDPTFQEAIQQVESADFPPGTVAAEVQAGYRLGNRLIRPAMVVVAKRSANGG